MRDIKPFKQGDPRWGSIKIGKTNLTMAGYGCYITTMACGLSNMFMKDIDPKRLVEWLNANEGIDRDGQLIWSALRRLFPDVELYGMEWTSNVPNSKNVAGKLTPHKAILDIRAANLKGQVVGICVDLIENNWAKPDHIVLAHHTPDNLADWTIVDPAFGDIVKFTDRYGDQFDNIYGYRILCGTPANFPEESSVSDKDAGAAIGLCLDDRYDKRDILRGLMSV